MTKKSAHFKISVISKILVACYLLISAVCIIMAFSTGDPKGNFVFLQLPIALQLGILPEFALDFLQSLNFTGIFAWLLYYLIFGGATVILLIFIGNFLEKIFKN